MTSPNSLDFLKFFLVNFVPELKDSNLIINNALLYESLDQAVKQIDLELRPNNVLPLGGYEMEQSVDVQLEGNNDNIYTIEFHVHPIAGDNLDTAYYNLQVKNIHYVAMALGNQQYYKQSLIYNELHKFIFINICNFNMYPDEKEFVHYIHFARSNNDIFFDQISIIVVELLKAKKFNKKLINKLTPTEAIAFFLLFADDMRYKLYIQQIIEIWEPIKMAYNTLQHIKSHIPETKLQELKKLQHQIYNE
jgi:hypothetical protein